MSASATNDRVRRQRDDSADGILTLTGGAGSLGISDRNWKSKSELAACAAPPTSPSGRHGLHHTPRRRDEQRRLSAAMANGVRLAPRGRAVAPLSPTTPHDLALRADILAGRSPPASHRRRHPPPPSPRVPAP